VKSVFIRGRCLLLLCTLWVGCTIPLAAQTPNDDVDVVRVNTDVTNLPFTVVDKQHRFITTLNVDDIRVLEDVVPFTGQAYLEQGLTRDVLSVYRVLQQIDVAMPAYEGAGRPLSGIPTGPGLPATPQEGTTAIWDAIALTSNQVLGRTQDQRRRAIILLTDGLDTSSRLTRKNAINEALAAETVVYAIGIGDSKGEGVNKGAVREIAESTGGRAFFPKKTDDLQAAFDEIEKELRTQYLIAYSSTNKKRDGAYRKITVEVTNPELKNEKLEVRHRPGYFAKKG